MGRYRKIDVRIWNDRKFVALPDDGKLVVFFLLTHPHLTQAGAARLGMASIAEELAWDQKRAARALDAVLASGMVRADWTSRLVWFPNFLRYNPPKSRNAMLGLAAALDVLPECELKNSVVSAILTENEKLPNGFQIPSERISDSVRTQEQEQEQEHLPPIAPPRGATDTGGETRAERKAALVRDWQAGFGPIYELFWRKGNREDGEKAWAKLRPANREDFRPRYELIKGLLVAQSDAMAKREPEYQPHIGPWLRKQRFSQREVTLALIGG